MSHDPTAAPAIYTLSRSLRIYARLALLRSGAFVLRAVSSLAAADDNKHRSTTQRNTAFNAQVADPQAYYGSASPRHAASSPAFNSDPAAAAASKNGQGGSSSNFNTNMQILRVRRLRRRISDDLVGPNEERECAERQEWLKSVTVRTSPVPSQIRPCIKRSSLAKEKPEQQQQQQAGFISSAAALPAPTTDDDPTSGDPPPVTSSPDDSSSDTPSASLLTSSNGTSPYLKKSVRVVEPKQEKQALAQLRGACGVGLYEGIGGYKKTSLIYAGPAALAAAAAAASCPPAYPAAKRAGLRSASPARSLAGARTRSASPSVTRVKHEIEPKHERLPDVVVDEVEVAAALPTSPPVDSDSPDSREDDDDGTEEEEAEIFEEEEEGALERDQQWPEGDNDDVSPLDRLRVTRPRVRRTLSPVGGNAATAVQMRVGGLRGSSHSPSPSRHHHLARTGSPLRRHGSGSAGQPRRAASPLPQRQYESTGAAWAGAVAVAGSKPTPLSSQAVVAPGQDDSDGFEDVDSGASTPQAGLSPASTGHVQLPQEDHAPPPPRVVLV